MYKINIYVTTYKNAEYINRNIERFVASLSGKDLTGYQIKYFIINNHSSFYLEPENARYVSGIFHNTLRPDNSCGHLARDWNSALMHGFKNLNNPDCDQVICAHDDSFWHDDWFEKLRQIHEKYTLYFGNYGCSFHSYLPDAVKKIGLWDERFCNIGYHEGDYLLRALIYNKDKSSLNDFTAGRVLNPTTHLFDHAVPNNDKQGHIRGSIPYHSLTGHLFVEKWGVNPEMWEARGTLANTPKVSLIKNYLYYPYFEKDVDDLEGKNYSFSWTFSFE